MKITNYLESTILGAAVKENEVALLCEDAAEFGFPLVMVNPCYVSFCRKRLPACIGVGTVADFPLGASDAATKVYEAKRAIENGASDVDVVAGVASVYAGRWEEYRDTIAKLREATEGATLKIILETSVLTREQIIRASEISAGCGVDFVKTSTGFVVRGASVEDLAAMAEGVRRAGKERDCLLKASGGIRTLDEARKMIGAGASRIGTSQAARIAREAEEERHAK